MNIRPVWLLAALLSAPSWAQSPADIAELRTVAANLGGQLASELKKEASTNGAEAAVPVCRDKAPALAGELSRQTGWRITRVSLKPRNSLLGSPDIWEQQGLAQLQSRLSAGEKPETLELAEIVQEPNGRYLRYLKGAVTQQLCVSCHGTEKDIMPNLQAKISQIYPKDQATGFSVGQLRGAISIKKPLN